MKIKKLTPGFVMMAKAAPGADRTTFWDQSLPGFGLMVMATGHRSFVFQYRAHRRSRRMTIDGTLDLSKARKIAKGHQGDVAHDLDPLSERRKKEAEERKAEAKATNTLQFIAENYLAREGKNLRSVENRERVFENKIYPALGALPIDDISRADITNLLDQVDDDCGPTAADATLAILRRLFSWHASRSEFRSPIVRGMARTKPDERARKRVLNDDELRAVWKAATATEGPYGALVRFLLLTGARRDEAREMPHSEVADGVWTLPPKRHKTGKTSVEKVLPLSKAAQAILASMPVLGHFVFSVNGRNPIGGLSKHKIKLDKLSGVTDWRIHDTRRTARSLMSRAGVDADIAERCVGHVIGGVRGVYDRHAYLDEMRLAFEKVAALIEGIVSPQPKASTEHHFTPEQLAVLQGLTEEQIEAFWKLKASGIPPEIAVRRNVDAQG